MNVGRLGLQVAEGLIGIVWLLIVLFGTDPVPNSPLRRRRFAASMWVLTFFCWVGLEVDQLPMVPRGVWYFSMAGLSGGLIGSLLLLRAPKNDRAS
ncbi:MAG: hypothetical protein EPN53_01670 [Acidobacteria bacterium]|nr:MAG: hypothetical protein EPN53_01670 [Acidobacteriota bacterium]